jgi:acyl-CoA dehydrogenase
LQSLLRGRLAASTSLPSSLLDALGLALDRAIVLAERVAGQAQETLARQAATALYDVSSAVLLAWEGSRPGADARRALLSRFVLTHRLSASDPLAPEEAAWEAPATAALLNPTRLDLAEVAPMLG